MGAGEEEECGPAERPKLILLFSESNVRRLLLLQVLAGVYLRASPPMSLLASNWLPTTSYRVVDPIENLRLQVTLRKRGTQGVRKLKKAEKSPSCLCAIM